MPTRLWMIAEASLYQQLVRERELCVNPARCDPDFVGACAWPCTQTSWPHAGGASNSTPPVGGRPS